MSTRILEEFIEERRGCTILVFYKDGGVAIDENNAYAYSGIPTRMANAIKKLINNNCYINEIVMSNDGKWLIVYNRNGFISDNLPSSLYRALHRFNNNKEKIRIVAFDEYDNWVIVTDRHYLASSPDLQNWIRIGREAYGRIEDIYMSCETTVACFEDGYRLLNVPPALQVALDECEYPIRQCSFNIMSGRYFILCENGHIDYLI